MLGRHRNFQWIARNQQMSGLSFEIKTSESVQLTKFQKLMLINAQPIKFWLNLAGGFIALYLLWEHEIIKAILIGGPIIFAGTFLANKYSRLNEEEIAKTKMGIIFLQYSTKFGFACYLTSHVIIPLSIWYHNLILTAIGVVVLIVGLAGWSSTNA